MFIFLLNKHISGGAELLRLAAIFSRFSLRCVLQFGRVGVRFPLAPYRTIGGSTLIPVLVPAAISVASYRSSVSGIVPAGWRLPFRSYESSVFGSGLSEGSKKTADLGQTADWGVRETLARVRGERMWA